MKSMIDRRLLLPLLLAVFALSSAAIHPANAAGLLYVNPPQQGPFTAGTSVTYQVKVANVDPFNGWDMMVKTDPTAINATSTASLAVTPNLLSANFSTFLFFELIHCVNGAGTGCTIDDGPGIVHSAIVGFGPPPMTSPVSGVLFTITYTAGSNAAGFVHIFNDIISDGTPTPVAHTDQDGVYGVPPDFTIAASPASPSSIPVGSSATSTITLTSLNGFPGAVSLKATSSPTGLTTSFSAPSVTLTAGGTGTSTLTITAPTGTAPVAYTVTVNGTATVGGVPVTHLATTSVTVTPGAPADFTIAASPASPSSIPAGSSATSTITLNSQGFTGSITLAASTATPVTGLTFGFGTNPVSLAAGGTSTSVLTIATTASTPAGTYTITVTGIGTGVPSHSATVTVVVVNAPNLAVTSVTVSTSSATIGQKVTITVGVTNIGTVDVSFTVRVFWGSAKVTEENHTLSAGQPATYTLTWDTTQYGAGTATISARIPPVPNEVDTSDNIRTGPSLTLVAPAPPLLTSSQALIAGGGAATAVILLALFLFLRRKKTPTV